MSSPHDHRQKDDNAFAPIALAFLLAASPLAFSAESSSPLALLLQQGAIADYGASPWYTETITLGNSSMKLALDSGANFIWATSDLCTTDACNNHQKVSTTQTGFSWIDQTTSVRSFGPWGSMTTETGSVTFNTTGTTGMSMDLFASTNYSGGQFKYLAWGGGIGFPSTSSGLEQGSSFYFANLYHSGAISQPSFSLVTEPTTGYGFMLLGGDDPALYKPETRIELKPNTTGQIDYIWGTDLYSFDVGSQSIPALTNARFYLDSGSSLFKGDEIYITPILQQLVALTDKSGKLIFDKVYDADKKWVSLVYANGQGPGHYTGMLPDITLTLGQSCAGSSGQSAQITLSPAQYSYLVAEGDRAGSWVPAFSVLNGVGGLLVGSTFMDLLYTNFNYVDNGTGTLTQGNMYLYQKSTGSSPAQMSCVATPHPIEGTWVNSYCSQVTLALTPDNSIIGTYTSYTGSTGSSNVVGWLSGSPVNVNHQQLPVNPEGTPIALGIQWRLINDPVSAADGSWHWVSNFSGQFHPQQIVREGGQQDYQLNQTLEVTNGLLATATVAGLTSKVPQMWPQTLTFGRIPPPYCEAVTPPPAIPFSGTATDNISGTWRSASGAMLTLIADIASGNVFGNYASGTQTYDVIGLVDAITATPGSTLVEQGLALAIRNTTGDVFSMSGGVNLAATNTMTLWVDDLTVTTWTDRFMQSDYDKTTWSRVQ
ncbi:MAG: A1 family peptidase [Gammaproteobacteria bacterium]|nr:A1 family peptidase [Gammaproteobacteria bacterium]